MEQDSRRWLNRFVPGLGALKSYDRSWFRYDLLAGISVVAVAVPIAIAYSQIAGLPPVHGLYASILPLMAYAFMGTSRQLIVAPDAATCAVVATMVAPLAQGDPVRTIALTSALAMLTGIFCIVAGIARLGFLTNFLARPILTGYLNGIALSIISGQLGKLFGFTLDPAGFFRTVLQFVSKLNQTHVLTLVTGLGAFLFLRLMKHQAPKVPSPLIVVILGIAASSVFHLAERGVALLGSIPPGLPPMAFPRIGASDLQSLALDAAAVALISFNSAMVTARGFAAKNRYEIRSNQEFIALGVADIGAGLMQGFAVSGADSRTAVNDSVGGKSPVTSLVAAVLIVLVLLFLTGPLALLPIAVLAAVLVHAVLGLFDFQSLTSLRSISPQEFRLAIVATLGVITVGVLPGVAIAVGLAMAQLLMRASRPHDAVLGQTPGDTGFHNIQNRPSAEPFPGLILYRFDSALVFFNSDFFKDRVRTVVKEAQSRPRFFLLDAESMPFVDTTGTSSLAEVVEELAGQGIVFVIADAREPVRRIFERAGLKKKIGDANFFPTLESAVETLK